MFEVRSCRYASRSITSVEEISFVNGEVYGDIESIQVITLNVPKTNRHTSMELLLPVAGPLLWNSLPSQLKCEMDFENLKKLLKTHLYKCAYC